MVEDHRMHPLTRPSRSWLILVLTLAVGSSASCAPDPEVSAAAEAPAAPPARGLPLQRLKLPPGFTIDVWASDVPNARSLAMSSSGIVFVGSREGDKVTALRDADGDGHAEQRRVVASGLKTPNGVAFREGSLYVAEIPRILRFDSIDRIFEAGFTLPAPVIVNDKYPSEGWHGWKFIAFGPDGLLYVPVGAPCNTCEPVEPFASLTRLKPDGTAREIVARGIRNTVGFDWHPVTKELWFTDNGADDMGDEVPNCELNRVREKGLHFGFPYCHQGDVLDPEYGTGKTCASYEPPAWKMGPHHAPLGMRFYTGSMFPQRYRNAALIAEHGSWNRSKPAGYRVTAVFLDASGTKAVSAEPLVEGFLADDGKAWGRPVDVLMLPDGSLLISDDRAEAIYRLSSSAP